MDNREVNSTNHPPTCTCADCVNKRLAHFNDTIKFNSRHPYHPPNNNNKWQPKQRSYPRHVRIIANIILSLAVILLIAILGTAGYAVTKYHGEAWEWVTQKYQTIENWVSNELFSPNESIVITPVNTTQPTLSKATIPATTAPTPTTTSSQVESPLNDPTWQQLVSFLQADNTDTMAYVYPTFVCANFAHMLQDHATKAGWRCAVVDVQLNGYPDWYRYGIPSNTEHSCNVFQTTDRGIVYIDCTGMPIGSLHQLRMVKVVDLQVGKDYIPISLFPEIGWSDTWNNMGTVTAINSLEW